ncbi:MAG: helicase HerA-like domain-containing protein [Bacteroidota bacterium]
MMSLDKFTSSVTTGYTFNGKYITLGTSVFEKSAVKNLQVKVPLTSINRHGLIAGATGTGKTKSLQNFAESLSENGISVLMMDIKGDLSGIAKQGTENPKIAERHQLIGSEWKASSFPTELLTISNETGVRMRATVSEFGPVLFSKILELNDNQAGVVAIVFKYADEKQLPILDIKDFRKILQHLSNEGKAEIKDNYGAISPATANVILRKLIELETQGAEVFFGETSFEVEDLVRKDSTGKGYINILRLVDVQDKPKLFSTFMLCLLAEVYQKFPEVGDKAEPKLVIFIDEAHLIFNEASKELLNQLETIIKLIRSKGVGIYFCTQQPTDIPDAVLGQLGLKIQHALRAFTAKDRKAIKLVAENYPESEFYKVDELITELGIGEAFVTVLNEKGIPTPLVHTLMCAPRSRMDVLSPEEQKELIANSRLADIYNKEVDRESAYEMLNKKIESATINKEIEETAPAKKASTKAEPSFIEQASKNAIVKSVVKEVTRGLFGMLFGKRR